MMDEKHETIADIVAWIRRHASVYGYDLADRIEEAAKREREAGAEAAQICGEIGEAIEREAWQREHSQTETAIRYEYAIQRKYKGEWQTESNGFKYIYDAKVNMNILRGIFQKAELRIVRRQADWEVVE